MDEQTGWHLEANGPVIELRDGQVVGIRHNDLDRLPDLPPASATEPCEIDEFYAGLERAHASWDRLIAEDKYRLVMKLQSGDTMIVANQVSAKGSNELAVYNPILTLLFSPLILAVLSWEI